MAIHNSQLKIYNGSEWDIYNPKTLASLVGTVAQGGVNYDTSRQFVTGDMLDKLSLSVNSADSFLTLDSSGIVPFNSLPVDLLTGLDAVPYDGTADPADGDLLAYKNRETSYIKQSALSLSNSQVGLGNVDNTSDANKPVSTAQQTALNLKVNIADIVNNLTSIDTAKPLSAAQGKILQEAITGKTFAKTFASISLMVTHLNSAAATAYPSAYMFNILALNVPDFWVTEVMGSSVSYTYTTDAALIAAVQSAPVQIGYYKISLSETAKVDLTNYVQKTRTIAGLALSADITKSALQTALDFADKVDKVTDYGLSKNDYSDTEKAAVAANTAASHTHSNKAILDDTTASFLAAEKTKLGGIAPNANHTYIGPTAPTGMIEGDLWFDTSA